MSKCLTWNKRIIKLLLSLFLRWILLDKVQKYFKINNKESNIELKGELRCLPLSLPPFLLMLKDWLSNPAGFFTGAFQRSAIAGSCLRGANKGWHFAIPPRHGCSASEARAQRGAGKRHETSFKIEIVQSESMWEKPASACECTCGCVLLVGDAASTRQRWCNLRGIQKNTVQY